MMMVMMTMTTLVIIIESEFVCILAFFKIHLWKPQGKDLYSLQQECNGVDMSSRIDADPKKREERRLLSKRLLCARPQAEAFLVSTYVVHALILIQGLSESQLLVKIDF